MVPLICVACGECFDVKPHQTKTRQFCSRSCATRSSNVARATGEWRACADCGAPIYAYPNKNGAAHHRYRQCKSCYLKHSIGRALKGRPKSTETRSKLSANRANRRRGESHPGWKGGFVMKSCLNCRSTFEVSRRRAHIASVRFCSTGCWYAWVRDDPTRSPTWKGGYISNYGPSWQTQARLARERDGHTCQCCGLVQKRPALDVHHIKAFRLFDDAVEANALSNLTTLCHPCHGKDGGPKFHFRLSAAHAV